MTPSVVRALKARDPKLAELIERIGPLKFSPKALQSPYEALIEAVVYQQLTGKAAATIFGRVKALFPNREFPTPQDLIETSVDAFRAAGLSRAKAASVLDIAQKVHAGEIPDIEKIQEMSDEEIVESLTKIRGVGPWTAEMFLIFRLGRRDVLPVSDYGVRKGYMRAFRKRKMPEPKELQKYGIKWKPYRTTAALYLWRAADEAKRG